MGEIALGPTGDPAAFVSGVAAQATAFSDADAIIAYASQWATYLPGLRSAEAVVIRSELGFAESSGGDDEAAATASSSSSSSAGAPEATSKARIVVGAAAAAAGAVAVAML